MKISRNTVLFYIIRRVDLNKTIITTAEIYINSLTSDRRLKINEIELHDTIDDVFKNVGNNKQIKKTWWYYINFIFCCGDVKKYKKSMVIYYYLFNYT
jgi:hypothetical protein